MCKRGDWNSGFTSDSIFRTISEAITEVIRKTAQLLLLKKMNYRVERKYNKSKIDKTREHITCIIQSQTPVTAYL